MKADALKRRPSLDDLRSYFKIGKSSDYILLRGDFPIADVSPSDFSRLCVEMFRRNDEVMRDGT